MQIKYNNVVAYTVSYNGDGNVAKVVDNRSGITTEYEYDSLGRLIHATERVTDTNEVVLGTQNRFDSYGRPLASIYTLPSQSIVSNVGYLPNSSLISRYTVTDSNNSLTRTYTYDGLQRVTSVSTMLNDYSTLQESYTYVSNGNRTSSLVSNHTVGNTTYNYLYDALGNITRIYEEGVLRRAYTYDSLGQLISESIYPATGSAQQYQYTYDKSGNVTNVQYINGSTTQNKTYTYGNTSWGDLLTNYNGTTIAYEPAGNPLNWRNADTIEWYGRQMSMFSNTNGTVTYYTYNADGIRTEKQSCDINGSNAGTVKYTLDGSKIVAENRNGTNLYYLYDDNGAIMGIGYGDNTYTFAKNIQGDVIGIYSGGTLVAKYEYSAYGEITAITNASGVDVSSNATHIANINPFRYRGYYYDTETGFYYLQSRYYDPIVGRFINADAFVSTGQGILGNNMFAYCGNNPVVFSDPYGYCHGYPNDTNLESPNSGVRYGYQCGNYGYHVRHKIYGYDYYLPQGGVIKGYSVKTLHVTTHYSDVTYIPPTAVREYYINEFVEKNSDLGIIGNFLVAILDILFGTKFTGAVLLTDQFFSALDSIKKNGDDDIIRNAMKNGNGIVIYNSPKMSGDPRLINIDITFYFEWTGRFGQYPYACYPFKQ